MGDCTPLHDRRAKALDDMTDEERKQHPLGTGVIDYFPDALLAVAAVSKAGNDQHNPGQPLHWAKHKSTDHANCLQRHFVSRGTFDKDGGRHSAKLAWRALALLQTEIEAERAGLSVAAYLASLEAAAKAVSMRTAMEEAVSERGPTPESGLGTYVPPDDM